MTMESMVLWLKNRRFEVEKKYLKDEKVYEFKITKDGYTVSDKFKYPETRDMKILDIKQREFLNDLIGAWDREYMIRPKGMLLEYCKQDVETVRKIWNDPTTGKKYSYDWGFDPSRAKIDTKAPKPTYGDLMDALTYAHQIEQRTEYHKMYNQINHMKSLFNIKNVIFSPPATIVYWADGTKTVVKAQGTEQYDPEKGLAMAIAKRAFGNQGNYYEVFKKWVKEEKPAVKKEEPVAPVVEEKLPWLIWVENFNDEGLKIGAGLYPRTYLHKSSATRAAKKLFGNSPNHKWIVSQTNPWT